MLWQAEQQNNLCSRFWSWQKINLSKAALHKDMKCPKPKLSPEERSFPQGQARSGCPLRTGAALRWKWQHGFVPPGGRNNAEYSSRPCQAYEQLKSSLVTHRAARRTPRARSCGRTPHRPQRAELGAQGGAGCRVGRRRPSFIKAAPGASVPVPSVLLSPHPACRAPRICERQLPSSGARTAPAPAPAQTGLRGSP